MEEVLIKWYRLPHCPPNQLTKPKHGTDAGFDIRAAEDTYIPSLEEYLNNATWTSIGEINSINLDSNTIELAIDRGDLLLENNILYRKEYKLNLVPTGFCISPMSLLWCGIFPRSSLGKYGLLLSNSVGVVDHSYRGAEDEVMVSLISRYNSTVITRGERIAQLIPMYQHVIRLELNEGLPEDTGRGGFGTTGNT